MRVVVLFAGLLAALPGTGSGATYHLSADGAGDFPTITEAIAAAETGDSILLAAGLYLGPGNTQLNFGGKDIVLAGAGPEATILDCEDSGVPVLRIENGETRAAVLRDMTLRNNYHYYAPTGVIVEGASPSFIGVHLEGFGGGAYYYPGGALDAYDSSLLLRDVEVRNCYSRGGLRFSGGAPELERVLVEDCSRSGGEYNGGPGGGISVGGNATLREVTVRNCGCWENFGGGVIVGGAALFEDCVFEGNGVGTEIGYTEFGGGGVACAGGSPTFRRCVFRGNYARDGGGGLGVYGTATPVFEDVLFLGNASDIGGSIIVRDASPTFRRTTVLDNRFEPDGDTADGPSAIHCIDASPTFEQVIVAYSEQGVGLWADAGSALSLSCSDVFANPGGNYGGVLVDQTGANGNISADPLFCDAAGGDYSLDGSSPCLPWNNDCELRMGAFGLGCGFTPADDALPAAFALAAPHPNPFNPKTTLRFDLPRAATVRLDIVDVQGRRVARLLDGAMLPPGQHSIDWMGRDDAGRSLPSGVYFARFEAGEFRARRKLVLLR